ncbi:MAG TPA: YciI family protein [Solirubrobacteraceae bacterium]|jgi:hypothetical protein|nr:YciI family protein [Solirubrobacteraceae bacterium]
MTQYLLTVYQPTGGVLPEAELAAIMRDVDRVDQEMKDAGVWVFAGGLHPPSTATVLRPRAGDVLMTDGPFTEAKEHVGGFTIIKADDLDEALDWGRRLAAATTLPIEVRPFQD